MDQSTVNLDSRWPHATAKLRANCALAGLAKVSRIADGHVGGLTQYYFRRTHIVVCSVHDDSVTEVLRQHVSHGADRHTL